MLRVLNIELVVESVGWAQVVEAREKDPQGLVVRLTSSSLEMIVDRGGGAFGDAPQWIFPD